MATKILWFSRHDMSEPQLSALVRKFGEVTVTKVNGTIQNVHTPFEAVVDNEEESMTLPSFKAIAMDFDVLAIVAPTGLQEQILAIAGDKPVIMTKNLREFKEDGEAVFTFLKWFRVIEIKIVTEDFAL
jgi:hypothetical protein